jgi:hypothetical protein
MTRRTWFERAIGSAAPAIRREIANQLANPVDEYLGTSASPDLITESLTVMDGNLRRRAATPPSRRGPEWTRAVNLVLDYRLMLMAHRDHGCSLVHRQGTNTPR